MTPHPRDELERELGRQLHGRVDGRHDTPFGLRDVRDRAAQIRRHRRMAVGAAIAAVLAIILPAALLADHGLLRSQEPEPAHRTHVPARVVHTALTLDGLARRDPPGIEYFTEDGIVLPGQGPVALPTSLQALVASPADGGWLALGPARDEVRYLNDAFEDTGGSRSGDTLVTSPDQSYAAWTTYTSRGQTLRLHSTTGRGTDASWDFDSSPPVTPVGVLGDDRVLFETAGGKVGIAEPDGSTSAFAEVAEAVAVSADGLVSVITRSTGEGSGCFGIVDTATDPTTVAWETCHRSLGHFSPDGRYLLAAPAHLDAGAGHRSLTVLDARTHRVVATFNQPRNGRLTIGQRAWESDSSALAFVSEGSRRQALLRFGVDGTLERATAVVDGSPLRDVAFYLGDDRTGH